MKNRIKHILFFILFPFAFASAQPTSKDNLEFNHLAKRWDEAMPLGNGMLGVLIWQKDNMLRLSLDRADLWDERKAMDISKFNFKWVTQHVRENDYDTVHKLGDAPYDNVVYPTKLPAGAIEFNITSFGNVVSNVLDISTALNTVKFQNGVVFNCYIHAIKQQGYFGFENLPSTDNIFEIVAPKLIIPNYSGENKVEDDNTHAGEGLQKLGYTKGTVIKTENSVRYHQPTYNNHYYEVLIEWKKFSNNHVIGTWTISNDKPAAISPLNTNVEEPTGWNEHVNWWQDFWSKSSVSIPDSSLEKQYWLELYKLRSVARAGAPAITLQAVWTADNGNLPPWKGDFHNDLNTQLSYWPAYTSNHLKEALTYTDWLWKTKLSNQKFTKQYFGVDGLNVPGVETISGYPMGGWIQYSLSPTTAAWCTQHFYWQWKYSMDKQFLETKAYPYIHDVSTYLENITTLKNGVRQLPISSSPEYNDNNINAWFLTWTNYDLSLAKFLFSAASQVSAAAGKNDEAKHWKQILNQLPDYDINETGLTVAHNQNLDESHRHMSPYMSIYPLALLDINNVNDKTIIENSLKHIEQKGTRNWCGYSFAWMASLYARAYEADSAVKQLQIFASNFCSTNSFHLNGDQKGGEYSNFTYRPFTLEGNFAFAEGVQELLLQSRNNYIQVFPAIPSDWQNVSFNNLRAEGAFLISAKKENNSTTVIIKSEAGGVCKLKLPFSNITFSNGKKYEVSNGIFQFSMQKNETVEIVGSNKN
ncbi:MAG TPA: glycoside hydrolase N-terminal domain-containing protein [Parafilimonas sp.]|nr:glycoside hydrolase N-terminal domain-containing protein [Parafilimonas sp.]